MDKQEETSKSSNSRTLAVRQDEATTGLRVLNLLDEKQLVAAETFLKKVISSDKSGIKSIPDGLSVLMRAQDLQLPFSTCIEHIHVINGKTGVDVHIIKTLLLRAGVTWECTKDYTPQYQYTDGNTVYLETQLPDYCVKCRTADDAVKATTDDIVGVYPVYWYMDLKGNIYNEFQVSDKCVKAINKAHAQKLVSEGKYPIIRVPAQPIDYVTEYEFSRCIKQLDGSIRKMTAKSRFSYSEAQAADLFTKDTYKKYARVLIGHRAFTLGARDIASDVLMGVMEKSELKIVENVDLSPDDYEIAEVVE
jgi:hypothetical protein